MTPSTVAVVAAWSYGLAAVGYLAFGLRVALGWTRSTRAALLLAATRATVLWAACEAAIALTSSPTWFPWANAFDTLRYAIWFAFVGVLIAGGSEQSTWPFSRWVVALVGFGLIISLAPSSATFLVQALGDDGARTSFAIRLGLAVFGLVLIEQLIRRAHPQALWGINPLCVALAGVFGYELFLYADAMLFAGIDPDIWAARGLANALVVPLIAIAMARNPLWTVEMHVSRQVVVRSTALLVSAAFLLTVAGAGFIVRAFGGDWGRALQIEVLFAALVGGVLVASSGKFRSKLKVFVSKHFFSYRYDYREEWLRFTGTLSTQHLAQNVQQRVITALAVLVDSPAGMLWLNDQGNGFRPDARWNMPVIDAHEPIDAPLVSFLERTTWIVNVNELASDPKRYGGLEPPGWLALIPEAWLIVPLIANNVLLGFAVLASPRAAFDVDWEVRDLLKTASKQAASYLAQLQATDALLEARKFEAFNRMSAFVVHDLKNLVAQLSLMLRNAERHRDNPEFQKDMLSTVENVVGRMHKLMLQLRTSATPVENARPVALEPVVQRVYVAKAGQGAPIAIELEHGLTSVGHEDRLEHVIGHLVQNAIDATEDGGAVGVRLYADGKFATVEVNDTGVGMSPAFVRERLFKPFQTTKPAGMGIGVYESSQYVAGIGGNLTIDSEPGQGTRVRVRLPLSDGERQDKGSRNESRPPTVNNIL